MTARGFWLGVMRETQLSERHARLTSLICEILKAKLLMSDADELPLDKSYFELGLTSLGAVELQEELEVAIDRRIDATNLYNNPTVKNLISHLSEGVLNEYFAKSVTEDTFDGGATPAARQQNDYTHSAKNMLDDMLNDL